jgi:hypothetical protein
MQRKMKKGRRKREKNFTCSDPSREDRRRPPDLKYTLPD